MQKVPQSIRRFVLVGILLAVVIATSIITTSLFQGKKYSAHADQATLIGSAKAKYTVLIFLDGTLPGMITPQNAPFITSLGQNGVQATNVAAQAPGDSITDITSDLTGAYPTNTGLIYETVYDRHYNHLIELDETPVFPPGFSMATAGNLVNAETLFQAAKSAGLGTEFISKYPAYTIENGPQSLGPSPSIDVLRTPTFQDFTGTPQEYDTMIFNSMRSDILAGPQRPNLYVIYAQSPNALEKRYGINAPEVSQGITFEDGQVQQTVAALKQAGIYDQTDIIVTSDHGNTAVDTAIPDSGSGSIQQYLTDNGIPVVQATADQVYLVWLQNPSQTAAAMSLLSSSVVKKQFGIDYFVSQNQLKGLHAAPTDRTPDFAIQPTIGQNGTPAVVYTSPPLGKHVEHGGFNSGDLQIPLYMSGPGFKKGVTINSALLAMQVGPTIARNMGLNLKTADVGPMWQALTFVNGGDNSGATS